MECRQSKAEGFKDFLVGLRALAVFLFCALLLVVTFILCSIGAMIVSPVIVILSAIALSIGGTVVILMVVYFLIKAIGANIRKSHKEKMERR